MFHLFNRVRHYKKRCRKLLAQCKANRDVILRAINRSSGYCIQMTRLEKKNEALTLALQAATEKIEAAERAENELQSQLAKVNNNLQWQLQKTVAVKAELLTVKKELTEWKDADLSALKTKWLEAHCHTLNHQHYGDGQFFELWEQRQRQAVRGFLAAHQSTLTEADITNVKKATDYHEDADSDKGYWRYDVEDNDIHFVKHQAA